MDGGTARRKESDKNFHEKIRRIQTREPMLAGFFVEIGNRDGSGCDSNFEISVTKTDEKRLSLSRDEKEQARSLKAMTATLLERNNGQGRTSGGPGLVDRAAMRFVLDRRLGRLLGDDPRSGEPVVVPVHYVPDGHGGLLTTIPTSSGLARSIRENGRAVLSVTSHTTRPPLMINESDDVLDASSIWHVQADVEGELLEESDEVREVLRRQIDAVLEPIPQADKSDPLTRAARTTFSKMVGVRLRVTGMRAQVRS